MTKHRQAKGRLGHKHITGHQFEGRRGAVGFGFVIAGNDHPAAAVVNRHLRAAQDMTGRKQGHRETVDGQRLTIGEGLEMAGAIGA